MRQRFTGYEKDTESDLEFAQARYYNHNHGRFTSPDPYGASASVYSPQTFNRYAYVMNNPLNSTDPTGMLAQKGGCPEGVTCEKDKDGNEFYRDANNVVHLVGGAVVIGATVTVAAKGAATEVVHESGWLGMAWFYTKRAVTTTGRGVVTIGNFAGAGLFVLFNPHNLGCGGDIPPKMPDGNGGCVNASQSSTMSDEDSPADDVDTSANENPEDNEPDYDKSKIKGKENRKGGEPRRKEGKHGQFRGRDAKRANDAPFDRAVKAADLNKPQRRRLHDRISGGQYGYEDILAEAMKIKGGN